MCQEYLRVSGQQQEALEIFQKLNDKYENEKKTLIYNLYQNRFNDIEKTSTSHSSNIFISNLHYQDQEYKDYINSNFRTSLVINI